MNPFAQRETPPRRPGKQKQEHRQQCSNHRLVFRQTRRARSQHETKLAGDLEEHRRDHGETVGPYIPRGQEAQGIAKGPPGPDVQAALQRHLAVQVEHRDRHRQVEQPKSNEPGDELCPAQTGSDAHPRAAHHGQNLGQHQVAQAHLLGQMVNLGFAPGVCTGNCAGLIDRPAHARLPGCRYCGAFSLKAAGSRRWWVACS